MVDKIKSLLQDPPPAMAFEVSEAGIAAARIGARTELEFVPLRPGTLAVSPLKENVLDADEFMAAVRSLAGTQAARRRKDAALILPDFSARISVLDFDHFPKDAKEQASLIRFRLKRSVPFDVETAALSYWAQDGVAREGGKAKVDVVVVMAPLEIVSRYEAPFRMAGMNPGLVTTSSLAALELAPEGGLSVLAKLSGRVLTVLVRDKIQLKLVRCLELPSPSLADIAAVLIPTFVYIEDNLGRPADKLFLCGFGAEEQEAERRFAEELSVEVEPLRSPLGTPGENNAGLLGYLRSIARNN
jgi:type IV pilus assembly protein PilM